MRLLFLTLLMMLSGSVDFDKKVHDFGKITTASGEQNCTFTLTNNSSEDVCILAVTSSCGCTKVSWTRELIAPGKTGTVSASYSNDEGPYPFDKTLNVYISGEKKPVILHLRGIVTKK
ncbi:MAG: DUF1573 domain-containing protein [Bacteroidales bacterium]|nr:DUF1573 domain-containing protein [Candidatus Cryptobacteroides equifaecalis]